ncbi:lipoyl(octanoyl) transferase LipB [endosymbiont of unidentified scaly snail isolate Monju]|uniref:lipoyl(octanoyl) transferase LipB n=1 Tax=endosymbiont of unidentified scaly snail isolate Monju TaxID=1248727 RepID=UPI001E47BED8
MRAFTNGRTSDTPSELWVVEHDPVFTQGQAGRTEHLLAPGDIPVVQTDRGGQVTYHGPGQLVVYVLLSLREAGLGVRALVSTLEQAVIDLLDGLGIVAHARPEAPGVYVGEAKIAALGLRVRRGYSYHGLALNVDLDLEPFSRINPCGYAGMPVTRLRDLGVDLGMDACAERLVAALAARLGYAVEAADDTLPTSLCLPDSRSTPDH